MSGINLNGIRDKGKNENRALCLPNQRQQASPSSPSSLCFYPGPDKVMNILFVFAFATSTRLATK